MHKDRHTRGRWEKFVRYCKLRIIHVNDSAHRIALGVAIGIFVGWTPVFGPHMIIALILCALLRANKLVGIVSVWICNPLTFGIIYGPSYLLGRAIVRLWKDSPSPTLQEFWEVLRSMGSLGSIFTNFHRAQFWHDMFDIFVRIGIELWIGCLILGFLAAICSYILVKNLIIWHRRRNPHRRYAELA